MVRPHRRGDVEEKERIDLSRDGDRVGTAARRRLRIQL